MDTSLISTITQLNLDANFDVTSAIKGKYQQFIDIFSDISRSMTDNSPVTFPSFPNQPVSPDDASFSLFSNYSMNQLEQQLQVLMDAEKWKGTIDKQAIQMM